MMAELLHVANAHCLVYAVSLIEWLHASLGWVSKPWEHLLLICLLMVHLVVE